MTISPRNGIRELMSKKITEAAKAYIKKQEDGGAWLDPGAMGDTYVLTYVEAFEAGVRWALLHENIISNPEEE